MAKRKRKKSKSKSPAAQAVEHYRAMRAKPSEGRKSAGKAKSQSSPQEQKRPKHSVPNRVAFYQQALDNSLQYEDEKGFTGVVNILAARRFAELSTQNKVQYGWHDPLGSEDQGVDLAQAAHLRLLTGNRYIAIRSEALRETGRAKQADKLEELLWAELNAIVREAQKHSEQPYTNWGKGFKDKGKSRADTAEAPDRRERRWTPKQIQFLEEVKPILARYTRDCDGIPTRDLLYLIAEFAALGAKHQEGPQHLERLAKDYHEMRQSALPNQNQSPDVEPISANDLFGYIAAAVDKLESEEEDEVRKSLAFLFPKQATQKEPRLALTREIVELDESKGEPFYLEPAPKMKFSDSDDYREAEITRQKMAREAALDRLHSAVMRVVSASTQEEALRETLVLWQLGRAWPECHAAYCRQNKIAKEEPVSLADLQTKVRSAWNQLGWRKQDSIQRMLRGLSPDRSSGGSCRQILAEPARRPQSRKQRAEVDTSVAL